MFGGWWGFFYYFSGDPKELWTLQLLNEIIVLVKIIAASSCETKAVNCNDQMQSFVSAGLYERVHLSLSHGLCSFQDLVLWSKTLRNSFCH